MLFQMLQNQFSMLPAGSVPSSIAWHVYFARTLIFAKTRQFSRQHHKQNRVQSKRHETEKLFVNYFSFHQPFLEVWCWFLKSFLSCPRSWSSAQQTLHLPANDNMSYNSKHDWKSFNCCRDLNLLIHSDNIHPQLQWCFSTFAWRDEFIFPTVSRIDSSLASSSWVVQFS